MINNLKILKRTLQTYFNRRHPYYAHICVTQRCNLKCSFCKIWESPLEELALADWKKIIITLDKMGVALLSFTGGEPLLYHGIFELIDYAASTGLATAITSNGVNNIQSYADLLKTNIHKISISLDSIDGDHLPYSHANQKILDNIEFINKNKNNKVLTVSTVLFNGNENKIERVIRYCEDNNIKIFVQPVVTGKVNLSAQPEIIAGSVRKEGKKVAQIDLESPYVLNPKYFNRASVKYSQKGSIHWNCLSGELFFQIKPNGEFWLCQDYPTSLNIQDIDFETKWCHYDFDTAREQCMDGCIYSCYYVTQKMFELKYLRSLLKFTRQYR